MSGATVNRLLRQSSAHVFVSDIAQPVLEDSDEAHLRKSLRLREGEPVTASDGAGSWRLCTWTGSHVLDVAGEIQHEMAPQPALTVAISPVKGDRTDYAVEKLTEVGIDHIVVLSPVRRSVVRWDDKKARNNLERWERIVRAAAMQSRRVFLPRVSGPLSLSDAAAMPHAYVAEPGGSMPIGACETIVIGPEGGFDDDELTLAKGTVDLGPAILRAETAAIVAATLMVAHRGHLSDHTG